MQRFATRLAGSGWATSARLAAVGLVALVVGSIASASAAEGTAVFGSFVDPANAQRHAENLAAKLAIATQVVAVTVDGVDYYRVSSAPTSVEAARELVAEAHAMGLVARYAALTDIEQRVVDWLARDREVVRDPAGHSVGMAVFGSFRNRANAERHAANMSSAFAMPVRVVEVEVADEVFHRVVSEPLEANLAETTVALANEAGLVARLSYLPMTPRREGIEALPAPSVGETFVPPPEVVPAELEGIPVEEDFDLVTTGDEAAAASKLIVIEPDKKLTDDERRKVQKSRRRNQRRYQDRNQR